MNLQSAKTFFTVDRMDWNKPHLSWVKEQLYRTYSSVKGLTKK